MTQTRVFGAISDYEKSEFRRKCAPYLVLDPQGWEWFSLAEIINHIRDREEFRHAFGYARMVSMLRTWCLEVGLRCEIHGTYPHEEEGFVGLSAGFYKYYIHAR